MAQYSDGLKLNKNVNQTNLIKLGRGKEAGFKTEVGLSRLEGKA
jgi:hypothetical protein